MAQPTNPIDLSRINAMHRSMETLMVNLYTRWRDERGHEDIAEYQTVIQAALPEGFRVVRMSKAPFGFTFSIGTDATYKVTLKGTTYAWSRI